MAGFGRQLDAALSNWTLRGYLDNDLLGCQSASAEARGLYRMLGAGSTIEELRELIAVPPRTERILRFYAQAHPEEAHAVESNLKFRNSVAREFERLVREGIPVAELPEEESELDGTEESYAVAQP
jgi:hypothetical protein